MDARSTHFSIQAGDWQQLGAYFDGEGTNFALFSAHAERVELCLYNENGSAEIARIELPEYTNEIWHGYLPGVGPGMASGFMARMIQPTVIASTPTSCCLIPTRVNSSATSPGRRRISATT